MHSLEESIGPLKWPQVPPGSGLEAASFSAPEVPVSLPSPRSPSRPCVPKLPVQSLSPDTVAVNRAPGAEGRSQLGAVCLRPATAGRRPLRRPALRRTWPGLLAPALFSSPAKADGGKEQLTCESGEDEDDEEEEEDFKPSDGSENEMETEMLDYV